jgi:histidinol phosphatase-like PHP family hydrolase
MERRTFIKNAGLAGGMMIMSPRSVKEQAPETYDFPLVDLHVHLTNTFTIDMVMAISEKRKVKFGILDHPAEWAIRNDADLKRHIEKMRKYPVFIGLQPMTTGWDKNFSPEMLKQLDYVLMDPQTIPDGKGDYMRIWNFDTYVENTDAFMERYMEHCLDVLNKEPINIFGWPLFLPVCIARDYYTLWTEKRMHMSHTPHDKFILMAKEQGLKFTFGSDQRSPNAGRLDYCKAVAKKCRLQAEDFYIAGSKTI